MREDLLSRTHSALHALGLVVARGCGLVIGLECERCNDQFDDRRTAGIRSRGVAALIAALAQEADDDLRVPLGGALTVALVEAACYRSRSRDSGSTTEPTGRRLWRREGALLSGQSERLIKALNARRKLFRQLCAVRR